MTQDLTSGIAGLEEKPTPTNLKVLTGVSSILCAAHRSVEGTMHGHTWEITCWWKGVPDAVQKQQELNKYLSIFDHAVLADGIAWAEKLAETIMLGMGCEKVEVRRPLERLYAVVERI